MRRLGLCLFGLVFACGGGDDSPEGKCNAALDTICDRVVDCEVADSHAECIDELEGSVDCSEAEEVGDNYDECLGAVEDASCNVLFGGGGLTLPSSCGGAL